MYGIAGHAGLHLALKPERDGDVVQAFDIDARDAAGPPGSDRYGCYERPDRLGAQPLPGERDIAVRAVGVEQFAYPCEVQADELLVCGDYRAGGYRVVRVGCSKPRQGLAVGRQERRQVDEPADPFRNDFCSLADDDATEAVANQHHRFSSATYHGRDAFRVGCQRELRYRRVIVAMSGQVRCQHPMTQRLQFGHYPVPAPGAVPAAVYKNKSCHDQSLLISQR